MPFEIGPWIEDEIDAGLERLHGARERGDDVSAVLERAKLGALVWLRAHRRRVGPQEPSDAADESPD